MPPADPSFLSRAREACAVLPSLSAEIETQRRLPPAAVEALTRSGIFKMVVPAAYGGGEVSTGTFLQVLEDVARLDGSAGWAAMIGASSGLMAAYLEPSVAQEIYGPPDAVSSGVAAPLGRATPVDGGFKVSGRWPFSSGCEHSRWRMGGAVLMGDGGPQLHPNGVPKVRWFLFDADQTQVIDTWHVSGMRGTGSHDLAVDSAFVPAGRAFSLVGDKPRVDGALYKIPLFGLLASGVGAVALGIARGAVDALVQLANAKPVPGTKSTIAQRELVQFAVAQAEAKIRGAHAQLVEALDTAEQRAREGAITVRDRAMIRLASCQAATEAAAAVDLMYGAGGGTSIYATSPLQRHFRDVHVATQHAMVAAPVMVTVGKILLGVETDTTTL